MKAIKVKEVTLGKNKTISKFVPSQLPLYVRENYPDFIEFMQHYYKWLEQNGNVVNQIFSLPEMTDINSTPYEYLEYFAKELAPTLPDNTVVDKRILLKHIKEFYLSKGTSTSIEFLFRVLFGEEVEITYPGELVLRCSDGEWMKSTYIKSTSSTGTALVGRKIFGMESGASAVVDNISQSSANGTVIDIIQLSNLSGVFLQSEQVETRDIYEYYSTIVSGQLWKVEVLEEGSGYSVGENIPLTSGAFDNATIQISAVTSTGGIKLVDITYSGLGYMSTFNVVDVNGKGAKIKCYSGGVFYDKGSYISDRGKLSSLCVLQDGYKHQTFSYVINSTLSFNDYKQVVRKTSHPAGLLMLGNVNIIQEPISLPSITVLEETVTITHHIEGTAIANTNNISDITIT